MIPRIQLENKNTLMSDYNLLSAETFAALTQREPKEILRLMLEISENSRFYPDQALLVPFTSIPTEPPNDVHARDFGWLFAGEGKCRTNFLPSIEIVNDRIKQLIPFGDTLSWNGYVAAGSFAALICQGLSSTQDPVYMPNRPRDVDFYPYCSLKDRGELSMEESAMLHYVSFLDEMGIVAKSKYLTSTNVLKSFCKSVMTKRNLNCTTVTFERNYSYDGYSCIIDYQFIHRDYASPTAVVIGFDLLASKVFYDGKMVYFTVDAAMCLYFGINPVDWRRESPSHMHRIDKYQRYSYTPIFVGLESNLAKDLNDYTGYYLRGCQLMRHGMVTMHFAGEELEDLIKELRHPTPVDELKLLDRSWMISSRYSCLNIEDVPDSPFSKYFMESDYDGQDNKGRSNNCRLLSMAIKKKYNLLYVYCEGDPVDVISNAVEWNLRSSLLGVIDQDSGSFFAGTNRIIEIDKEIKTYVIRKHGVPALKAERERIIDDRVKELEARIQPYLATLRAGVKFEVSKAGGQFSCSFKSIVRNHPREYWGSRYSEIEISRLWQMKLTLLCIRKYHNFALRYLDKHMMAIIFFHLANAHVEWVAYNTTSIKAPQDKLITAKDLGVII
jgi:hypothetical protein